MISFDGLVFPALDGGPIQPAAFTRWFQARAAEIELPQIGPHGLRHTWATLALRAGVHPKVVAERLGHSSIRTTLDRYSHAIPEMDRDAAETVAALIRR